MKRVACRDEQALSEIYDIYSRALYSIIFNIIKCEEETKDIMQQVLLLVWQKAISFDSDKGNLFTWLVTLARNKALDKLRSKEYRIKQLTTGIIDESRLFDYSQGTSLDVIIAGERVR
ncbi:MAG: RNA polymerase sigma factor, partial [Methanococcaceae archaeon]